MRRPRPPGTHPGSGCRTPKPSRARIRLACRKAWEPHGEDILVGAGGNDTAAGRGTTARHCGRTVYGTAPRTAAGLRVSRPAVPTMAAETRNDNVTAGRGSRARDRGGVTVEYAVLFPVLLVLLLSSVQAALWWHTRNIALAAAQAGVNAGRATGAGPGQAVPATTSFADRAGGSLSAVTTAGSTATTIRVQVSLTAPRVLPIPGLSLRVTQTAVGGRERFTTPQAPP